MREKRYLIINLKSYRESFGNNAIEIGKHSFEASKKFGVEVVVCPPIPWLNAVAETGATVFAQHCDSHEPGPFTGFTSPEMISASGGRGVLVNHSEHRIKLADIESIVEKSRALQLIALVCADTPGSVAAVSALHPDLVAIEPPELIGTGISVSKARPEVITKSIQSVRQISSETPVIAGAGITSAADVRKAYELGASGALVASAIVKSNDRRELIFSMCQELSSAEIK
ncbi:MAG: triose-phosphate isomerase [Thermoplasmata archaeon]|nr:triose-phosphate isomerase [Candidatus Sysuiplasma jiujiangense]